MLSRVAENLYWHGRYLERAEDLGRLINVNAHLMLDLPRKISPGWAPLIRITASQEGFDELFDEAGERQVVRFLLADERNPGSILSSLHQARENLRAARDLVPREVWEETNNLYLLAQDQLTGNISKRRRHEFLRTMILRCQQISGMLTDTMSHDHAWNFMLLGRYQERADMTTRILDVRSADLLPKDVEDLIPYDQLQWMSVLKSLTAYQMYRRHVRLRVRGPDVLRFLLRDPAFPRSVAFCLQQLEDCLAELPDHEDTLRVVARLTRMIDQMDAHELVEGELTEFLDRIQSELVQIGDSVVETWFQTV